MPKNLAERFDDYEAQANSNRDRVKGLANEIKAIQEENTSLHCFCFDHLITIYKHLSACNVKTRESLHLILTMHRDEQRLNVHLHKLVQHLEALLGQLSLPLRSTKVENESNATRDQGS